MPDSWRRRADDALVTLARDRWTILTGYAFLLTGDRQEAEDLVQEALVRTFARSRSINPAAMEGYVRRAILTVYIDGHRRRRRWRDRMHLLVPPQAHDGPDAAVGQGIEVRDALAALPRQQRACVVLRFYDELSIQEVADTLGLGVGTVKRYLSLAMRHLEAQLGPVRPAEVGAVRGHLRPRVVQVEAHRLSPWIITVSAPTSAGRTGPSWASRWRMARLRYRLTVPTPRPRVSATSWMESSS